MITCITPGCPGEPELLTAQAALTRAEDREDQLTGAQMKEARTEVDLAAERFRSAVQAVQGAGS
jgi:hypothetical protein